MEGLEERGGEKKEGDAMEVEEDEEGEMEGGCNKATQSSPQLQQKIHNTIVQSILPSLDAILTKVCHWTSCSSHLYTVRLLFPSRFFCLSFFSCLPSLPPPSLSPFSLIGILSLTHSQTE